jgi:DNA replication protein DnaC
LSRLPVDLRGRTFFNYNMAPGNADALEAAICFANDPRFWLMLHGSYGGGKTHLAAAIANHLVLSQRGVIYCLLAELLDDVRRSYSHDYHLFMEQLKNADVLIVDEMSHADLSKAWSIEKVVQLFEHRYQARSRLGTVFVGNFTPEEIECPDNGEIFSWIFSRLKQRSAKVIHVNPGDVRSFYD